ncbi:unnamed protein product [Brachionus calyciflorus]|uniref:Uncharacterized protein n=1 Tax=Brachionus calyciflorus TaxID=104777 RepID=A0A814GN98_9BILA|nr:unnamed protein product [Brachionus calyciflorus]
MERRKRQKPYKTLSDLLNEQIPFFLSQAREKVEKMNNPTSIVNARPAQSSSSVQTSDHIPLVIDSKQDQEKQIKILQLRNKALECRVTELELELAEKTMAIEKLERERSRVKEYYTSGLDLDIIECIDNNQLEFEQIGSVLTNKIIDFHKYAFRHCDDLVPSGETYSDDLVTSEQIEGIEEAEPAQIIETEIHLLGLFID